MSDQRQLLSVTSLQVTINRQFPPSLVIEATGESPVPRFTDIQLAPHTCTTPPEEGIYAFSLTGIPPQSGREGTTAVVATPYRREYFPEDFRGVMIYADNDFKERVLFTAATENAGLY